MKTNKNKSPEGAHKGRPDFEFTNFWKFHSGEDKHAEKKGANAPAQYRLLPRKASTETQSSDEDSTESDNDSSEEESGEAVMLAAAIATGLKTLKIRKRFQSAQGRNRIQNLEQVLQSIRWCN